LKNSAIYVILNCNMTKNNLILKGLAVSVGLAEGKVKIVKDFRQTAAFKKGEVLVTEMTDPTMVIMMSKASAIITDTGGIACHAAIVSREMGIPCVVATKNATKVLKDGQKVKVDGKKGLVYLAL